MNKTGEYTRRRILNEVISVGASRSFHEMSVSKIAERLHISDATIYGYFHNKKNLLKEAFLEAWNILPGDVLCFNVTKENNSPLETIWKHTRECSMSNNLAPLQFVIHYLESSYRDEKMLEELYRPHFERFQKKLPESHLDFTESVQMTDLFVIVTLSIVLLVCRSPLERFKPMLLKEVYQLENEGIKRIIAYFAPSILSES